MKKGIIGFTALLVAFAGIAFLAAPALGAPPAEHFHDVQNHNELVFYDIGLCSEDEVSWEISEVSNNHFHLVEYDDGTYHLNGTFGGKVTVRGIDTKLVEDSDGILVPADPNYDYIDDYPTYTGHYTQRTAENGNRQAGSGSFSFNVHLTGSDGSRIKLHVNAHFNVTPDGEEHGFEVERCS